MKAHTIDLLKFAERDMLDKRLAVHIAAILESSIKKSGQATLVVSGGSTPRGFFQVLSTADIDWSKVSVTLADERWVDAVDSSSNERLVKENLLRDKAAGAKFVPLYTGAKHAVDAEKECEEKLSVLSRPFDVVVLGMGNDGHTASLFPGADNLKKATDIKSGRLCVSMIPGDTSPERMTMTLPALLDSKNIFLHIAGNEKKQVLDKALCAAGPLDMPIRFIFAEYRQKVKVYWAP